MIRELLEELTLHLFLLVAVVAVPLGLLARKRIYPHTPLLMLMLGPCLLSLFLVIVPESMLIVALLDCAVVVLAVADLFSLRGPSAMSAERQLERVASLSKPHAVELTVVNHRNRPIHVWIRDDVPGTFDMTPQQFVVKLHGRSRVKLRYKFTPQRRGAFTLDCVHVHARSRWGFWKRMLSYPVQSVVHVYPNMVQLAEYAVLRARTV